MKPDKGNPQVGLRIKNWFLGWVLVIVSIRKSRAICSQVKGLIVCKFVNLKDTNLVQIGIRALVTRGHKTPSLKNNEEKSHRSFRED